MKINIGPYPKGEEERVVDIQVDHYDTWSMDNTLAKIILPLLKQLKEQKQGSPFVADEDVPEHLGIRASQAAPKENEWDTDEHWHKRWEYVLDCMIWSFEEIQRDWQDEYWLVKPELDMEALFAEGETEDDNRLGREVKWKVEGERDKEGYDAHAAYIQLGLTLFGKYYQGLWS